MKPAIVLLSLFSLHAAYAASPEATIGKDDCKVINPHPIGRESVTWTGPCKDGFAEGVGKLSWFLDGELRSEYEGGMQGGRYHGAGYRREVDGDQYEGQFVNGKLNGTGTKLALDRSRYDGQWKDGLMDGEGTMRYALGGSYAGQWRHGKFNGQGKATYIGGQVVEGEFVDGLPVGQEKPVAPSKEKFMMKGDSTYYGTSIPKPGVGPSPVPFRASWDALTPPQRSAVRGSFPMLHPEDEPPYPERGTSDLLNWLRKGQHEVLVEGVLRVNVMIDSSGTPSEVKVFSSPSPAMTQFAGYVLMKEKFKPGLCAGAPCAMGYPLSVKFSVEN
ncbi:MAG: hypothetical protein ACJ8GW_19930 [Massilia sp.]